MSWRRSRTSPVGVKLDSDLDEKALQEVVARYMRMVRKETGKDFPVDAREQLRRGINAVFGSWNNPAQSSTAN
jgi:pyruvate,orthophosphate dikinase